MIMTMDRMRNERLLLANQGIVYTAARRSLPKSFELDDWFSELNLLLWKKLHTYDETRGAITTWIMAVAFRQASLVRRRMNTLKRIKPDRYMTTVKASIDQSCGIDIDEILQRLDKTSRCYALAVMSNDKLRNFANENGLSIRQARYIKTKCRALLAKQLASYGVA